MHFAHLVLYLASCPLVFKDDIKLGHKKWFTNICFHKTATPIAFIKCHFSWGKWSICWKRFLFCFFITEGFVDTKIGHFAADVQQFLSGIF